MCFYRALYAYTASPDDPNEVSFAKGEILDVVDASGKWWQVRTSSNHVGSEFSPEIRIGRKGMELTLVGVEIVAPSNYLSLLN